MQVLATIYRGLGRETICFKQNILGPLYFIILIRIKLDQLTVVMGLIGKRYYTFDQNKEQL